MHDMSEKIVFVVGAGASYDLDPRAFPLGAALAAQIENQLTNDIRSVYDQNSGPIARAIMRNGGLTPDHLEAMNRLRDGIQSKPSIDEFINEWSDIPHLSDIGKLCIAQKILESERRSSLLILNTDVDRFSSLRNLSSRWIGLILNNINPHCRRRDISACLNGVSFVTFNYDRSIEQYLYHSFNSTFALSLDESRKLLRSIPIFHVYGSLGPLPAGEAIGVPFGAEDLMVSYAAEGIRTFCEEIDTEHAERIRRVLIDADRIIFLGCAYHPQNMEILFEKAPSPRQKIWGTTLGMRERQLLELNNYILTDPSGDHRNRRLSAVDCTEMISNFRDEIF